MLKFTNKEIRTSRIHNYTTLYYDLFYTELFWLLPFGLFAVLLRGRENGILISCAKYEASGSTRVALLSIVGITMRLQVNQKVLARP